MIMNNRIDEFIPAEPALSDSPEDAPFMPADIGQYAAPAKEWAIRNPLPCLAAAFVVGAALAWIIKRK
jgi:hypothetical protein